MGATFTEVEWCATRIWVRGNGSRATDRALAQALLWIHDDDQAARGDYLRHAVATEPDEDGLEPEFPLRSGPLCRLGGTMVRRYYAPRGVRTWLSRTRLTPREFLDRHAAGVCRDGASRLRRGPRGGSDGGGAGRRGVEHGIRRRDRG